MSIGLARELAAALNETAAGTVTDKELIRGLRGLLRQELVFAGMGWRGAMACYLSGIDMDPLRKKRGRKRRA